MSKMHVLKGECGRTRYNIPILEGICGAKSKNLDAVSIERFINYPYRLATCKRCSKKVSQVFLGRKDNA